KRFPPGKELDPPDLILGAGHKTHLPMLCAKRAYGGKTAVIMKPSLPLSCFDLALIPSHDNPAERNNTLITEGAMNLVTPSNKHDQERGVVMIGGPSKHYGWDKQSMLDQLNTIFKKQKDIQWVLTDSPRTPESFSNTLASLHYDNVKFQPWNGVDRNWLPEEISKAGVAWVSEDSISMVYESLTAGTTTGILQVPVKKPRKVFDNIKHLENKNLVVRFHNWVKLRKMPAVSAGLNEADRAASWILNSLYQI
nr:nucleoside-diphosphate sugar epimerase [Gammaproteobacteria bacterium]NIO61831.1 nucleoside-diphosphate sugar epimerase [Gammaproteobacteria bacterium]NIQ19080.1 nucleoside-diphosphate sugar epimerase [Gammaproteobacteria bacterium]NIT06904.1 nucleoside-diphosphate sugar epimerase [Gammaproteobacteria bacterium]NIT42419.1 nucleoside-diphosphate sugar epimerase [Gammaproteobacteria bacterium]